MMSVVHKTKVSRIQIQLLLGVGDTLNLDPNGQETGWGTTISSWVVWSMSVFKKAGKDKDIVEGGAESYLDPKLKDSVVVDLAFH